MYGRLNKNVILEIKPYGDIAIIFYQSCANWYKCGSHCVPNFW